MSLENCVRCAFVFSPHVVNSESVWQNEISNPLFPQKCEKFVEEDGFFCLDHQPTPLPFFDWEEDDVEEKKYDIGKELDIAFEHIERINNIVRQSKSMNIFFTLAHYGKELEYEFEKVLISKMKNDPCFCKDVDDWFHKLIEHPCKLSYNSHTNRYSFPSISSKQFRSKRSAMQFVEKMKLRLNSNIISNQIRSEMCGKN